MSNAKKTPFRASFSLLVTSSCFACVYFISSSWALLSDVRPYAKFLAEFSKMKNKNKLSRQAFEDSQNPDCLDFASLSAGPEIFEDVNNGASTSAQLEDAKEAKRTSRNKKRNRTLTSANGEEPDRIDVEPSQSKRSRRGKLEQAPALSLSPFSVQILIFSPEPSLESPHDRLMSLRHKLQKIFLSDSLRTDDFFRVDELMAELTNFEMTFSLLKVQIV